MTYIIRETDHGAGRAFVPHDVEMDGERVLADVDYRTARAWVSRRLQPGDIYREECLGINRAAVLRVRDVRHSERRGRDFDRRYSR